MPAGSQQQLFHKTISQNVSSYIGYALWQVKKSLVETKMVIFSEPKGDIHEDCFDFFQTDP